MSGSAGSMTRSTAPVCSSRKSTFSQVRPPSVVRKTPRSGLGPKGWPRAATYTRSGVVRIDADAADRVGIGEAEVPPALPGIVGAVDAVALEDVGAELHLAHADVDDIRVGRCHRDRADRGAADLPIGHRSPCGPAVGRLEQPTAGRAEVVLERSLGMARHRDRAAAPVRPDRAPLHGRDERDVVLGSEDCRHRG